MDKDPSEIAKLTERILKDPKSKLFVPLAEEYKKIGNIDMAVSVLTEGLKNNPGYVTARSFLGRLLIDQGDLSGAQKELEEVVNAIPDNLLAQRKLGDIFILLGKRNEALTRYQTALALNSSDKELASLVADLEAGKDVSGRIPKPKSPAQPSETKQPERAPQKTAAPTAAGAPSLNVPPPATQGAGVTPAAAVSQPAAAQKPPTAPAQETAEIIEEIEEVESLDQPLTEMTSAAPSPVGAANNSLFDASRAPDYFETEPKQGSRSATSAEVHEIAKVGPGKPASSGKSNEDINTDTLAELYIAQGFYDKAMEIYQRMLAERPDNDVLQKKVLKLQALAGVPSPSVPFPPGPRVPAPDVRNESGALREPRPVNDVSPSSLDDVGRVADDSNVAPEAVPMTSIAPMPIGREAPPAADAPKEIHKGQGGTVAASHAAIRRKETIDRLESWLKNILKEKPE